MNKNMINKSEKNMIKEFKYQHLSNININDNNIEKYDIDTSRIS